MVSHWWKRIAYGANYRQLVVPEVITWSGNGSETWFLQQNHPRSLPDWRKILPLSFVGVQSTEANGAGYRSTNYRTPLPIIDFPYKRHIRIIDHRENSPPMQSWKLLERISHFSCNTPVYWLHNGIQVQWLYVA